MGDLGTDIIVYSPIASARLDYIVKLLFRSRAIVTNEIAVFESCPGKKINYSNEFLSGVDAHIIPHSLLFEKEIQEQQISVKTWEGIPVFFETAGGTMPFDIFAASFYLITRYEEWLPHEKDYLGRYDYQQSIAYQYGFLNQPLRRIQKSFPNVCSQKVIEEASMSCFSVTKISAMGSLTKLPRSLQNAFAPSDIPKSINVTGRVLNLL